jgi:hypothetical protein
MPAPVVRVPGVPEPPRSAALGDCSTPLRFGSAISPGPPVVDPAGPVVVTLPPDDVPVVVLSLCAIAIEDIATMLKTLKATVIFFIGLPPLEAISTGRATERSLSVQGL